MPESSINGTARKLQLLDTKADFIACDQQLKNDREQTTYYAGGFDPKKPLDFSEFQKAVNKLSEFGLKFRDSSAQIAELKNLDLEGTGVLGKGAIAERIAAALPDLETLKSALKSAKPQDRFEAQFLLSQKLVAIDDQQNASFQKLKDAIAIDKLNQQSVSNAKQFLNNLDRSALSDPDKVKECQKESRKFSSL